MATKYEWFEPTVDDTLQTINPANWGGQTFRVGYTGTNAQFTVKYIKVQPYVANGTPGYITYSIRAVGDDSKPTGDDIASGSINSTGFGIAPGNVETINFGFQGNLNADTSYAICYRMEANGTIRHSEKYNTGTYAGGYTIRSYDSGATWDDLYTNQDLYFSVWGDPIATGTNMQINIGDTFKTVSAIKLNVGDVWKDVAGIDINVGDAWKVVF